MRWLPGPMEALLRTGQLQIVTGAGPGGGHLLMTRIGLSGDVLVFVDPQLGVSTAAALVADHAKAAKAALAGLRRMHLVLVGVANLLAGIVVMIPGLPFVVLWLTQPIEVAGLRLASEFASLCLWAGGLAGFRRVRRKVAGVVVRRVMGRYVRMGQDVLPFK
ncbi:hypothetical protein ACQW02_01790 [Humitalea sp. 24SJ18S-53]|uniref:hypothetical protein n=1 Tax=Humitalea sp. 24SJ18S-53 TaxID=3422307 RepID=UPI003D66A70C